MFLDKVAVNVDDPEDNRPADIRAASPQVINIDRDFIEEHLASCRNFIVEWTTKTNGPSYQTVLALVSRIDPAIRSKWTDMYRMNLPAGIALTNCIRKTKATAENQWAADLTRDNYILGPRPKSKPSRPARENSPCHCR